MSWGNGIILAFFVFGAVMFSMVAISMNSDVNLVTENYYEEEIAHEKQMDKIRNYNALKVKPKVVIDSENDKCQIYFPEGMGNIVGTVHFFRPSDRGEDKVYKVQNSAVEFETGDLINGLWTIKVDWTSLDKSYYFEYVLHK